MSERHLQQYTSDIIISMKLILALCDKDRYLHHNSNLLQPYNVRHTNPLLNILILWFLLREEVLVWVCRIKLIERQNNESVLSFGKQLSGTGLLSPSTELPYYPQQESIEASPDGLKVCVGVFVFVECVFVIWRQVDRQSVCLGYSVSVYLFKASGLEQCLLTQLLRDRTVYCVPYQQ